MNETPWFLPTDPPIRAGVYKTKHRASGGYIVEGYSNWIKGRWSSTQDSPKKAKAYVFASPQQSKAWCGLTEEHK